MTQLELNRAISVATGESVQTIARMGFNYFPAPMVISSRWLRRRRARSSSAKRRSSRTSVEATTVAGN